MTATPSPPLGPPVEALTRRLLETPGDVLAAPVVGGRGVVDAAAVVADLLVDLSLRRAEELGEDGAGPGPDRGGAGWVDTGSVDADSGAAVAGASSAVPGLDRGSTGPGGDGAGGDRWSAVGLDPGTAGWFRPVEDTPAARNWLSCVLVAAWLLHDRALAGGATPDRVLAFLTGEVRDLAAVVAAPALVADPDRREELARRALRALGLAPEGETDAQAADRLSALDSVERAQVLAATRAAEQRAAEVREALHAKRAAEAAAKASRE